MSSFEQYFRSANNALTRAESYVGQLRSAEVLLHEYSCTPPSKAHPDHIRNERFKVLEVSRTLCERAENALMDAAVNICGVRQEESVLGFAMGLHEGVLRREFIDLSKKISQLAAQ